MPPFLVSRNGKVFEKKGKKNNLKPRKDYFFWFRYNYIGNIYLVNYPYFQSWYLRFRLHCHIYPLKFFTGSISKSFNSSSFLLFSCNSKKYQPFLKMLSLPISFISENTFYIISYSISLFRYVATFYRMLQSSY